MRVALLKSHMASQGGLEKITRGLAHAFARRNCPVTLLTTDCSHSTDIPCEVIQLGYRSKFSFHHVRSFDAACTAWLQQYPYDIVFGLERNRFQTHYRAGSGVHAAYLAQRMRYEKGLSHHLAFCNPLHRLILDIEKSAFTSPQLRRLFTNSKMVKEQLIDYYKVPEHKMTVVPNGVDWERWGPSFVPHKPKNPFTFLFVGNGYKRKGLPFILKALPFLTDYDFQILVVGKDKGPPLKHPRLQVHGSVGDLTPFYQKAHALLLPSLYDPFANVTVEALAMGLFVVSSRFNGGCEILTPEIGTIIDKLDDPQSVAASMELALKRSHCPDLIRKSVQGLDFSQQLDKIVDLTLHD